MLRQLALLLIALGLGFLVVPAAIYFAGSTALGRYEGASLGRTFGAVYDGLGEGSVASWVVVLGPCLLYLFARLLGLLWRSGSGSLRASP